MKSLTVILIGFLLSLTVMFILANGIEQGDTSAVSMYFAVFMLPVLIFVVFNGLYIWIISKSSNRRVKLILCLVPIIVLTVLSLNSNLTIAGVDGNLNFAATVGAIALGLTNMLWILNMWNAKSA